MPNHHLPTKLCAACGRPFTWRKKWERDWEHVKYCSKGCSSGAVKKIREGSDSGCKPHVKR
ncbi:MAG: DUF2256 domain-containing protein [Phycisphaerales bacterium]